jgi:hypothetical protein
MADFEEMRNAMNRATQDDIVTRLREIQDGSKHDDIYDELMYAIDEIERLRKEINDSKS